MGCRISIALWHCQQHFAGLFKRKSCCDSQQVLCSGDTEISPSKLKCATVNFSLSAQRSPREWPKWCMLYQGQKPPAPKPVPEPPRPTCDKVVCGWDQAAAPNTDPPVGKGWNRFILLQQFVWNMLDHVSVTVQYIRHYSLTYICYLNY